MGPEVRLRPNSPDLCVLERPRAALWSGRGSPLGPGCVLGCPGCTCSYPWRWRWCADVFGPGVVRPALRILERRASERARCLGTVVHEHGRAQYCGLGRRSPLGLGCSLSRPGGTCSWVWRWRWCANMFGPEALLCAFCSGVPVGAEACLGVRRCIRTAARSPTVGAQKPAGPECSLRCPGAPVRGVGAGVTMHMALGLLPCATLGSVCIGMASLPAFAGMLRLFRRGGGGRRLQLCICTATSVRV